MILRIVCYLVLIVVLTAATSNPVTVTIHVTDTAPPTAFLSVSPTSIAPGDSTTVTWSSTNSDYCKGFAGLATSDATSGSVSVSPITTQTFGLSCVGAGGVKSAVATISVSQTNVVNANGNCAGAHAGTDGDPYPFSCIVDAINGLPGGGGTVIVGDGTWATNAPATINRGNFNLVGNSLAAKIRPVGVASPNTIWVNSTLAPGPANIRISNLTIDGSAWDPGGSFPLDGLRLSGLKNLVLSNNTIIGCQTGEIALVLVEGGEDNQVIGNTLNSNGIAGGIAGIQFNSLGGTPNSGLLMQGNALDSLGFIVIGQSEALITGNTMTNVVLGNAASIGIAPSSGSPGTVGSDYVIVDNNIMNVPLNGTNLAMLPQDPGPVQDVDHLIFSNNVLTATFVTIALQDPDDNCLDDIVACPNLPLTYNSIIINNTATSSFGGSKIKIKGGAGGMVSGVLVQGNTLNGLSSNSIIQDAHTSGATIVGNTLNP